MTSEKVKLSHRAAAVWIYIPFEQQAEVRIAIEDRQEWDRLPENIQSIIEKAERDAR